MMCRQRCSPTYQILIEILLLSVTAFLVLAGPVSADELPAPVHGIVLVSGQEDWMVGELTKSGHLDVVEVLKLQGISSLYSDEILDQIRAVELERRAHDDPAEALTCPPTGVTPIEFADLSRKAEDAVYRSYPQADTKTEAALQATPCLKEPVDRSRFGRLLMLKAILALEAGRPEAPALFDNVVSLDPSPSAAERFGKKVAAELEAARARSASLASNTLQQDANFQGFILFVDGRMVLGPVKLVPGRHLVQVTSGSGNVLAASIFQVHPGEVVQLPGYVTPRARAEVQRQVETELARGQLSEGILQPLLGVKSPSANGLLLFLLPDTFAGSILLISIEEGQRGKVTTITQPPPPPIREPTPTIPTEDPVKPFHSRQGLILGLTTIGYTASAVGNTTYRLLYAGNDGSESTPLYSYQHSLCGGDLAEDSVYLAYCKGLTQTSISAAAVALTLGTDFWLHRDRAVLSTNDGNVPSTLRLIPPIQLTATSAVLLASGTKRFVANETLQNEFGILEVFLAPDPAWGSLGSLNASAVEKGCNTDPSCMETYFRARGNLRQGLILAGVAGASWVTFGLEWRALSSTARLLPPQIRLFVEAGPGEGAVRFAGVW